MRKRFIARGANEGVKLCNLSFRCIETAVQRTDCRWSSECNVQSLPPLDRPTCPTLLFRPCCRRMDLCGVQSTGENEDPAAAAEPTDLRLGERKSGGGRGGSYHGRHGRVERVLTGAGAKDIEHRFDRCGAIGVRRRRGKDCAEAVFVDWQKIQRARNLIAGRNNMPGKQKPGLVAVDGPYHWHA